MTLIGALLLASIAVNAALIAVVIGTLALYRDLCKELGNLTSVIAAFATTANRPSRTPPTPPDGRTS